MTDIAHSSFWPAKHVHLDGEPLDQIGWWGATGRIYSLGEEVAATEPGGFCPIYVPWGESCGHQIRVTDGEDDDD